jgi:hypothetical protein
MEIRLIRNFTKGKYRAVNDNLMLQLVDGNREFDGNASKRIFLFNPAKNEHVEILPEVAKFDTFRIFHGVRNRDFFIFSHLEMKSENDVLIEYYCYRIEEQECSLIHTDIVSLETFRSEDAVKIFALTQDFCMFQTFDKASGKYKIFLKDITDGNGVEITNEELVNNGIDCIVPLAGNKCCFKVGNSIVGIVNINQFVSDMILRLPLVFTQVLDKSAGDVAFVDMYENNKNIIYTRKFPEGDTEEIVIYDFVNEVKKVRQNDKSQSELDYRRLCVIGDVPYVFFSDEAGTHFVNLNSQREDYLISSEYNIEHILGEYIITSKPSGLSRFSKKKRSIIQVYKVPDLKHHVYKKKGVYNGYVILDEDLLLFLS